MASRLKQLLNKFFKTTRKIALITSDIKFLKNCKHNLVFPKFINIKSSCHSLNALKAIETAKKKWLQLEINTKYSERSRLEIEKYDIHLEITKTLDNIEHQHWINWLHNIQEKIEYNLEKKNKTLQNKLAKLIAAKDTSTEKHTTLINRIRNNSSIVHNLTNKVFSNNELQLLNKGLNFSLIPQRIPTTDIIADIETIIKHDPDPVKHQIRRNILPVLKNTNNKITVENKNMHNTVKCLIEKDLIITKADKGNAVVILEKSDYTQRVQKMLDEGPYIPIKKDPLQKLIKQMKDTLQSCTTLFNKDDRWKLTCSNPVVPRLYALPKIHKSGNQVRPIVSGINSPTYKIAKWLNDVFNRFHPPNGQTVKDRTQLIHKIKDIKLAETDRLVSFDVSSLFPSVPIELTLQYLEEWLIDNNIPKIEIDEYLKLTRLCMDQNVFQFNHAFYKQTHGTSMGNPLSPFLANLFMCRFENKAKLQSDHFPTHWYRYVDDVLAIINVEKTDITELLNFLNSQNHDINFTLEEEKDFQIPFLDLLLKRNNGKIEFDIYRKPTHVDKYIHKDSFCDYKQKMAAFRFLINRLVSVPLSKTNFDKELNHIRDIATFNGYKPDIIDQILKKVRWRQHISNATTFRNKNLGPITNRSTMTYYGQTTKKIIKEITNVKDNIQIIPKAATKLKDLLTNTKDKIPNTQKSGIYQITCSCEKTYTGQTRRSIKKRFQEHISHIKYNRPLKSNIANHVLNTQHDIKDFKIIKHITEPYKLDAYESIFIYKNLNNSLNADGGPIPNSDLYQIIKTHSHRNNN